MELHKEIIKLRPDWYNPEDDKGAIKIVMTGSASDPLDWQEHIRNKERRKAIGNRLKDPKDPLKLLIVRDMFLTGFDAPCLHTMYVDKPMNGHTLMQAIARVNRVFGDKEGGLVVDYIGIAQDLKNATADLRRQPGQRPDHLRPGRSRCQDAGIVRNGGGYVRALRLPPLLHARTQSQTQLHPGCRQLHCRTV